MQKFVENNGIYSKQCAYFNKVSLVNEYIKEYSVYGIYNMIERFDMLEKHLVMFH